MIGELRHRVTIQRKSRTEQPDGGAIETWVHRTTVWAKLEGLSAQKIFASEQMQSRRTHKLTLRADVAADIDAGTDRLVFEGRTFAIKSPPLDREERGRFAELDLEENAPT